uniref:Uncharacterized protein n=1 Tax=Arundo donax TaxID=35708 RepID=A0A0A9HQQ8_ARUDO
MVGLYGANCNLTPFFVIVFEVLFWCYV